MNHGKCSICGQIKKLLHNERSICWYCYGDEQRQEELNKEENSFEQVIEMLTEISSKLDEIKDKL